MSWIIGIELWILVVLAGFMTLPPVVPEWLSTCSLWIGGGAFLVLMVIWFVKHIKKRDVFSPKHLAGCLLIVLLMAVNGFFVSCYNTAYWQSGVYGILLEKIEDNGKYYLVFEEMQDKPLSCTEKVYERAQVRLMYEGSAYGIRKLDKYKICEITECE